ncbi:glutamate--cysteine ligase [Paraliomyxa miuraensis]|uniref:glutamate--cysteine ligase n=1 Tax=Paraliomyxa miuraensis TaxID=376150 RepID=UPI002259B504|nr:glutamate-cysteine ligase family protein [Paraliomyxa miuraensis]MCX4245418.1 glutamate-cysteine ligase family protein [Paraliomyxa miuraensis]
MSPKRHRFPDEPITRDELCDAFVNAERSDPSSHLIGTELEKAGVYMPSDGSPPRPVSYDEHVLPTLQALVKQFGWAHGADRGPNDEIIDLVRDGASITLEPGGQLELSGAPLRNVHQTCAEFSQHYDELHAVSGPLSLAWMTAGHHPWATRDEIHWMPKGRYQVMRAYLPTRGSRGLDMMLRTCTVQANFDYASESQCAERFRLANAMAPVLTALFANSPYVEGRSAGVASVRSQVWLDVDPDRCGVPRFAFEDFSYERYVDWALDVPMFFVKRSGRFHPHHQTFRHFLEHGFSAPDGEQHHATHRDWFLHLSTVFPEVRLKPHLELRSADAVGSRYVCALPALGKALLYDDDAGGEAWERLSGFRYEERLDLWKEAIEHGLRSPRLRELARALLDLARRALDAADIRDDKGRTEARFIDRLEPLVDQGHSPAHEVLDALGEAPGRDADARRAFVRAFHFAGVAGPD